MAAKQKKGRELSKPAYPAGQQGGFPSPESVATVARIPDHGRFLLTDAAVEMIKAFGGTLHCYMGPGGCRKQGLYFSRTMPRKSVTCELLPVATQADAQGSLDIGLTVSVSHELAPKLDGAVLDFGAYNKMQRFVWLTMPAVKGPACTCLRSIGAPAGKRSPCLDDRGVGLSDL